MLQDSPNSDGQLGPYEALPQGEIMDHLPIDLTRGSAGAPG